MTENNSHEEKPRRFNQEQYEMILRCSDIKDMTEWNEWRKANQREEILLEGANLFEAHLKGAYLRRAQLEGTELWGVHLEGAILRSAHLEGAILAETRFEGADDLSHGRVSVVYCAAGD